MSRLPALYARLLGITLPASAQTRQIIKPGDMVRLVNAHDADQRLQGRVFRLIRDTLIIEANDDAKTMANGAPALRAVAFPVADLKSLEVQLQGRSHAAEGALIGGGLMFGLGMWSTTPLSGSNEVLLCTSEGLKVAAIVGAVGAVVGALLGSISHARGWKPAVLPGYAPGLDGGAGGMILRWHSTF